MGVKCKIIVEADYLCIRCTSTCSSVSDLKQVFQYAMDAARKNHKFKILIDAGQVKGQLATLERYEGASYLAEYARLEQIRTKAIAVIGREPLIDTNHFGETVARNRGVNGKVFSNFDEAVAWLAS